MNSPSPSRVRTGLAALTVIMGALGCESSPSPAASDVTAVDAAGDTAVQDSSDVSRGPLDGTVADSSGCGAKPTEMCGSCESDVVVSKLCVNGAWACPSGYVPELTKLCVYSCAGVSAPSCCTAAGTTVAATCNGPGPGDWQCPDGKAPLEKGKTCGTP